MLSLRYLTELYRRWWSMSATLLVVACCVVAVGCDVDSPSDGSSDAVSPRSEVGVSAVSDEMDSVGSVSVVDSWVPDVVDSVSRSLVRVRVELDSGGSGVGTGIVYSESGYVVTNWHVVSDASSIKLELWDGGVLDAVLVREDKSLDLAVLQVRSSALDPARLGDSDSVRVGEDVIALGYAFGFAGGPSVSRGIVSGLDRVIADSEGRVFTGLLQTDASISLGSSGGALVNSSGEVVGMHLGLVNVDEGVTLALDVNSVASGAERLIALGVRPDPGYLGVGGVGLTPYIAERLSLPVSAGFGVRYVDPDSPAALEFMVDDVIIRMNSTPIHNESDFTEFLRTHPNGTRVVVEAVRIKDDTPIVMEIPVTLGPVG